MGIYKRERITSKKIEIEAEKIHCDDVGLYILSQNPDLEFINDDFFEIFDTNNVWSDLAIDTIVFTIALAINNKTFDIYIYNDKVNYLWGLITDDISSYYFEVNENKATNDLFTLELIKIIKHIQKVYGGIADFKRVMKYLINKSGTYSRNERNEKNFVIDNIKLYAKKYPWLSISTKRGTVNFIIRKNKVDITRIYIPRISLQMQELESSHNELYKSNWDYCRFFIHLRNFLDEYFNTNLGKVNR